MMQLSATTAVQLHNRDGHKGMIRLMTPAVIPGQGSFDVIGDFVDINT